ncbi:hypothetical protein [Macrococcus brunensis]|uniref:hypothetical protein n=1 Tax=Macrococcus brunensis TaxID=198483 RepID=UPI001EF12A5D|nr:hypothetical protein [Macrococcus brunensis]ULG71820.1 hypothetical protein MGG12_11085 [Macrococcus brunensis]ULG74075.1 hypothetical protein MGG13_10570 [Macrococcus brunensis]
MENNKNKIKSMTIGTRSLLIVSAMLLNQAVLAKAAPTGNTSLNTEQPIVTSPILHTEVAMKAIQGYVMLDDDKDGVGDYNLSNSEVLLLDRNGNVIRSTWTDINGFYQYTYRKLHFTISNCDY